MVVAVVPLASSPDRWTLAQRVLFRFGFVYLVLYCVPFPIGSLPFTESIAEGWAKMWWKILPWVGEHLLGLGDVKVGPNGSGDTTADYVMLFVNLVLAGAATVVWSALDRRRPHYRTLLGLLRIYLRYTLALTMFSYGFAKVLPSQFVEPPANTLIERYGESSPMRLLWTFMGASTPYTVFAGVCEVLGGAFLLFRRTTLLGAVVLVAVVGNVVMLNFCYDVPVKLYSSHLLLIAIFLAAPDARRLFDFFVRNRATAPADLGARPTSRRWRIGLAIAKVVLIATTSYVVLDGNWEAYTKWGAGAPRDRLAGIWEVESPAPTWKRVGISSRGWVVVDADDNRRRFTAARDGDTITLTEYGPELESPATITLTVSEPGDGQLVLSGDVHATLTRVRGKLTLLLDRGFHWVNEGPYNR